MSREIIEAVRMLESEKGISGEDLLTALEDALLAAYKKTPDAVPLNANARSADAVPLFPNATDASPVADVARFAAKEYCPDALVFSPKAAELDPMLPSSQ